LGNSEKKWTTFKGFQERNLPVRTWDQLRKGDLKKSVSWERGPRVNGSKTPTRGMMG